ncbi:zinc ribbon domain-containing protein [Natrialba chahannaoensis]|nr:zinc ribbon domain-containing protein [Natrialba chahannaoensis]
MTSTPLPTTIPPYGTVESTPIGVDVGVKNLIAAASVDATPESAFVLTGDHLRRRHDVLVEAMRALQGTKFDTTDGQAQLFAALWHQIRPQVYDAAVRVVHYARQFTAPILVLEDLPHATVTLWESRADTNLGSWLLPTLQHAIIVKSRATGIPVVYVDPSNTTRQCHVCGTLASVKQDVIKCTTDDCSVETVCRDWSAAVSIAQRAVSAETEVIEAWADEGSIAPPSVASSERDSQTAPSTQGTPDTADATTETDS